MHLYFIKEADSDFIKIGIASNVQHRLAALQGSNPHELFIARIITNAGRFGEREAHARFAHKRVRGEWFKFCPNMLAWQPPEPKITDKTPIELLVEAFGGKRRLAAAMDVRPGAIDAWRNTTTEAAGLRKGHVPLRHHKRVREAAKILSVVIPAGVFTDGT